MRTLETLQLDGGRHVFDFTNTISNRNILAFFDYMETYGHFLAWCDKVQLLPKARTKVIGTFAEAHPRRSVESLEKVMKTREILFELFSAIANNKKTDINIVTKFNAILSETMCNIKIEVMSNQIRTTLTTDSNLLEEPLYVLVKDAYDVLTSEDRACIKECSGCGWLFLDTTKNGKRRWCNMQVCGSRDKASRYYERKKSA